MGSEDPSDLLARRLHDEPFASHNECGVPENNWHENDLTRRWGLQGPQNIQGLESNCSNYKKPCDKYHLIESFV